MFELTSRDTATSMGNLNCEPIAADVADGDAEVEAVM